MDKQQAIAIKNAKIDEIDQQNLSNSPKSGKGNIKLELKDNKEYMFQSDGTVIHMNSEMANKGKATRQMNLKNLDNLSFPKYEVAKAFTCVKIETPEFPQEGNAFKKSTTIRIAANYSDIKTP